MIKNGKMKISTESSASGYQVSLSLLDQKYLISAPVRLHLGPVTLFDHWIEMGYESIQESKNNLVGTRKFVIGGGVVEFRDEYKLDEVEIKMSRTVTILATSTNAGENAFISDFSGFLIGKSMQDLEWFAPGLWYLENEYVPYYSIGSRDLLRDGNLRYCYFREDRLSAPIFGYYDKETGESLIMLHTDPIGTTVLEDDKVESLTDSHLDFGSLGLEFGENLRMGFWFPGSECDLAYPARDWSYSVMKNNQLAAAKKASKHEGEFGRDLSLPGIFRLHPIEEGLKHSYEISFRAFHADSYPEMLKTAWRIAWEVYKPKVIEAPLEKIEEVSIQLLSNLVIEEKGMTGIPFSLDIWSDKVERPIFALGFVGRLTEAAYYLMKAGYEKGENKWIEQGRQLMDTWVKTIGPGNYHTRFDYRQGIWVDGGNEAGRLQFYMRPLAEAHLAGLRDWQLEKKHGVEHQDWWEWLIGFGNWLLEHQNSDGSFYRMYFSDGDPAWKVNTDCYIVIPFLLALEQASGDGLYLKAASRVASYLWENYHKDGHYIGGTIDNPSVYDKEAAVLSFEAYLALYERTKEPLWLKAAVQAADFTETWTYIWDIPLPIGSDERHWSLRASTVGLQLVCTGHSLSDMYLAFNPGHYARLYQLTGDSHYLDVAHLLLHNTKQLIWLDNPKVKRTGYQQEHWTFSVGRGYGRHSYWIPWVTMEHLMGMEKYKDVMGSREV